MPFIPPETIEKARQVDLLTYLRACEPDELVHISGDHYCIREHDSLKISNGKMVLVLSWLRRLQCAGLSH